MKVFLPSSLEKDVEERIAYAHELYAREVLPRVHGEMNPSKRMSEFLWNIDFEYRLEAVYLLRGEQKNDNVLITGTEFLGYKFSSPPENAKFKLRPMELELGPMEEGIRPVGVLHSHSGIVYSQVGIVHFSPSDFTILPLLKDTLEGYGCILMVYNETTRNYVAIDTSSKEADIAWYDEAS